jgi:type IV secretory pathway TraG/TraD family ATPase VirD4
VHSHGIVPIARALGDYRYRIYFSPRDRKNRSNLSWLDIDIRDPTRVLGLSERPLLTPGEVMQLPPSDELVLIAGLAPIRAKKLRYFEDRNFTARVAASPLLSDGTYADRPEVRSSDWGGLAIEPDARLVRTVVRG